MNIIQCDSLIAAVLSKQYSRMRLANAVLVLACLLLGSTLAILYIKKLTPQKLLSKLGIHVTDATDWSLFSWNSSLEQLDYDADIVFIGDSITRGEHFQAYFPNHKILNLGLSGNSVSGIADRAYVIRHFSPKMIFVMGGVNSLKYNSLNVIVDQYASMIAKLKQENPEAEIFIQSVLPIANARQEGKLRNKNIVLLNERLREIADLQGATYVDVHAVYALNGEMNPNYTVDGVHLADAYKHLWLELLAEYIK